MHSIEIYRIPNRIVVTPFLILVTLAYKGIERGLLASSFYLLFKVLVIDFNGLLYKLIIVFERVLYFVLYLVAKFLIEREG